MIVKSLLLISVLSISLSAIAAPTPAEEKQVVGYADDSGMLYNTYDIYGSVLSYYIPENEYTLSISSRASDGHMAHVDINYPEYVLEALREWVPVGISLNRSFMGSVREHTVLFGIVNHNDNSLGSSVFNPHGNSRVNIGRVVFNNIGLNNYEKLKQRHAIPADMSPEDYLRLKIRITLKHEIGHVLGLLHNNEGGVELPLGRGVNISNCPLRNQPPSIMLNGSNYDYIDRLSAFLERPVTVNDIGPSANDIAGARMMYNRGSVRSVLARISCTGALSGLGHGSSDL